MWRPKRIYFTICIISFTSAVIVLYIWRKSFNRPGTFNPDDHHNEHHHHHHNNNAVDLARDRVAKNASHHHNVFAITTQNTSDARLTFVSGSDSGFRGLLRILVLTYNRAQSLARCLESLNAAVFDSEQVVVEIHVDRFKDGTIHNQTLHTANNFVFKHGTARVFPRPRHVGVLGQWLNSWRVPRDNSSEIAVFVEDDITLSPYFARWLRKVHGKYDSYPGIDGYALQAESMRHAVGTDSSFMHGPAGQCVFLYPVVGSWGFSPHTARWREFLRWYHKASQDPRFVPHVPGLKPSEWYQAMRKAGRSDSMWTMWHIYYAYKNEQYTLYPSLPDQRGLAFNWKEPGEHFSRSFMGKGIPTHLLETWREEDVRLPEKLVIMNTKGKITAQKLSPLGLV